jgi:hypothetical protein
MRRLVQALGAVALAAALAGTAAAAGPAAKHTDVGTSTAEKSLLTLKDLGSGWQAGAAGRPGIHLSCQGWEPSAKGVVEIGAAATPSFAGGQVGPYVSQTTSVFASARQAATFWRRAVQPRLVTCVVHDLQTLTRKGVKVTIAQKGPLPVAREAPLVAGYRVVATLRSAKGATGPVYFDVLLLGKGSTLTEITLINPASAVPAKVEAALAKLVTARLPGPPKA